MIEFLTTSVLLTLVLLITFIGLTVLSTGLVVRFFQGKPKRKPKPGKTYDFSNEQGWLDTGAPIKAPYTCTFWRKNGPPYNVWVLHHTRSNFGEIDVDGLSLLYGLDNMADIRVYDRILTDEELKDLPSGAILWYKPTEQPSGYTVSPMKVKEFNSFWKNFAPTSRPAETE